MNSKKIIYLFVLIILLVFGILVVFVFDLHCIFKSLIGIPCPGCGLTRGVRELLDGNIIAAEKYNVLTIPVVFFMGSYLILLIFDLVQNTDKLSKFLNFISKQYVFIIVVILITWVLNIINFV